MIHLLRPDGTTQRIPCNFGNDTALLRIAAKELQVPVENLSLRAPQDPDVVWLYLGEEYVGRLEAVPPRRAPEG